MKFVLHKIVNWEYWPQWLVYLPITPVYAYYAFKARTPYFIVAANPAMENGGYLMESKFTIHKQLPQNLVPATFFVKITEPFSDVKDKLLQSKIEYPFFCKPDVGGKGRGVAKIENENQLLQYHQQSPINYLVQAAIPFKYEAGVFYCRLPGRQKGFISGIVGKGIMTITGDGKLTLKQFIEEVPRYYFQRRFLYLKYKQQLSTVIPNGEKFVLSEIGNHARGSLFTDLTHYNNKKLEKIFDEISNAYNIFYFGRYDIKFNSWSDLYDGKNFMIIELNGSGSEPTHIYDPSKSLWQAWKIIVQHWKTVYCIAAANHKNGVPHVTLKAGRKLQQLEQAISKQYIPLKNFG